jgi:hypothetical protein
LVCFSWGSIGRVSFDKVCQGHFPHWPERFRNRCDQGAGGARDRKVRDRQPPFRSGVWAFSRKPTHAMPTRAVPAKVEESALRRGSPRKPPQGIPKLDLEGRRRGPGRSGTQLQAHSTTDLSAALIDLNGGFRMPSERQEVRPRGRGITRVAARRAKLGETRVVVAQPLPNRSVKNGNPLPAVPLMTSET